MPFVVSTLERLSCLIFSSSEEMQYIVYISICIAYIFLLFSTLTIYKSSLYLLLQLFVKYHKKGKMTKTSLRNALRYTFFAKLSGGPECGKSEIEMHT